MSGDSQDIQASSLRGVAMTKQEKTIVIFRKWKDGQIIALFPTVPSDCIGKYCESFMHIGQHSGADYWGVVEQTKPAKWGEYQALRNELESAPYNYVLDVKQRAPYQYHQLRRDCCDFV